MTTPLHTLSYIQPNLYQDSVALMRVAQRLLQMPGVVNASLQMGSPANKEILQEAGLLTGEVQGAGPSDVMVVLQARSVAAAQAARAASKAELAGQEQATPAGTDSAEAAIPPRSAGMGLANMGAANIAQISVPGSYAGAEALKAVKLGLNVFLFSDNVPLAQEVAIKQEAKRRGLLVMGPDCGTAIIGGVPLGFANNVRRGNIGLVAASGTGLQEVTTQIHRMGGGISHAIGTGGRDVYAEVGGATMQQGIALLARDPATKVVVILSKPPAPVVRDKVMAALRTCGKPAVVLFLGNEPQAPQPKDKAIHFAHTLVDCAAAALRLAGVKRQGQAQARTQPQPQSLYPMPVKPTFAPGQTFLRALYCGGSYAAEAQAIWARSGLQVRSNAPLDEAMALPNPRAASFGHCALDLGDDAFTVGRPHPMIDQGARIERLLREAADPSVRVILLDVVIGWGAHADPSSELALAIEKAQRIAQKGKRHLAVIGFVCGTELDPQGLAAQEVKLRAAGMVLAGNSANAAWLAREWLR